MPRDEEKKEAGERVELSCVCVCVSTCVYVCVKRERQRNDKRHILITFGSFCAQLLTDKQTIITSLAEVKKSYLHQSKQFDALSSKSMLFNCSMIL